MKNKLKNYLSYGQVLNNNSANIFLAKNTQKIFYTSDTSTIAPVIPFQIFAFKYENDIVIETNHPKITMHEFAQININGHKTWIAKDSATDGTQTLTVPDLSLINLVPEVDIPRRFTHMSIDDSSTEQNLSLNLKYINYLNEKVEFSFKSPQLSIRDQQRKSNGPTFNHSKNSVSALLDISHKKLKNIEAKITFNGINYGIRKIFGIIPVKALLRQTQAGLSSAKIEQDLTSQNVLIKRVGTYLPDSEEVWHFENKVLSRCHSMVGLEYKLQYFFNDYNELVNAQVLVDETPIFKIDFSAPLPNFSRSFQGVIKRNFIIMINSKIQGQGVVTSQILEGKAHVTFTPTKPFWFKTRPLKSTISINENIAYIDSKMI